MSDGSGESTVNLEKGGPSTNNKSNDLKGVIRTEYMRLRRSKKLKHSEQVKVISELSYLKNQDIYTLSINNIFSTGQNYSEEV